MIALRGPCGFHDKDFHKWSAIVFSPRLRENEQLKVTQLVLCPKARLELLVPQFLI